MQVKTHKHSASEIRSLDIESLKVRLIVSNSNSPMDRITYLICHIRPLLDEVPSHLKNTHDTLTKLQSIPAENLKGKSFFTADVKNLYTNINVHTVIPKIIEFATENR